MNVFFASPKKIFLCFGAIMYAVNASVPFKNEKSLNVPVEVFLKHMSFIPAFDTRSGLSDRVFFCTFFWKETFWAADF